MNGGVKGATDYSAESVLQKVDYKHHKQKELENVIVRSLNSNRRDVMV